MTDVTLACEDGKQIESHKVVLAATSPFFLDLLKRNKHQHPLIYMKGIKSENLLAMVDFFYRGEANVSQENLEDFLALADEMRLKGLSRLEESEETLESAQFQRVQEKTYQPELSPRKNRKQNPTENQFECNNQQKDKILIVGNEGEGLPESITKYCNDLLVIPPGRQLHPLVDSLNVSVATALLLQRLIV